MNRSLVAFACAIALVLAVVSPVGAAPGDVSVGRDLVDSSTPAAFDAAPDGRLYVVSDAGLDRYGPDGEVDRTFSRAVPAVNERWQQVHALDDGAIVIGSTGLQATVVRLRADGTDDPGFGDGGRVVVAPNPASDSAVDAAGHIVLLIGSTVVRLLPDGEPDPSFGTDGHVDLEPAGSTGMFSFLDALPDGRTLVSGTQGSTSNDAVVERLTATGSVDATYGENGRALAALGGMRTTFVADAVALTDGSVVLSSHTIGVVGSGLIEIGPDGREARSASPTVRCESESLRDLTVAPDGSLLARVFSSDDKANTFTRLRRDLTVDRTFGTYGSRTLSSEAVIGPVVQAAEGRMVALERVGAARFVFIELGTTTTVRKPTGATGYWIVADHGGVFSFGDAPFCGSGFGAGTRHFVGAAASSQPYGYWLVTDTGAVEARGTRWFGDRELEGDRVLPRFRSVGESKP